MVSVKNLDVIIIGGGIAGLSLGALLSNKGINISLYEKSNRLGGRAQVWEHEGYLVDHGLHGFRRGRRGEAAKVAKELGIKLKFIPPGAIKILDEEGFHAFPSGVGGAIKTKVLTVKEKLKFIRFLLKDVRKMDLKSEETYRKSVNEYLDEINASESLRKLFRLVSLSAIIVDDLEHASLGELLSILRLVLKARLRFGHNVEIIKGSWKSLIDLLVSKIEESGSEIFLKKKVDSIIIESNQVAGIKCGDEVINSRVVVCAVPAQHLFDILDERLFSPEYVKKCKNLIPISGIVFDFGLETKISKMKGLFLTQDPIGMGQFTSNIDPSVAPEGKQLLSYLLLAKREELKDKQRVEELQELGRKTLFKLFPELESNIEWERSLRLEIVDGVELRVDQTIYDRPDLKIPNFDNLYLIGDTTNMPNCASGDISFASAFECSKLIEEQLKGP